jgi:four helix bundle protein
MEKRSYMNYKEWLSTVPCDITEDPLWNLEIYRLALFMSEIGWPDAVEISKNHLTRDLANQLIRAIDSISANIAEGYSRSTGKDKARFMEYALGSAREARDWYYKSNRILKPEVVNHRINLLTQIVKILSVFVPIQRKKGIREEKVAYLPLSELENSIINTQIPKV